MVAPVHVDGTTLLKMSSEAVTYSLKIDTQYVYAIPCVI
jgi:hypothetical protein